MKKEELQKLGLSAEQVDEVFKLNGKDVNSAKESAKAELENVKAELSQYKSQAEAISKELEGLKALKPEELSKEVSNLNEKLAQQKENFEKEIANRDFNDLLSKSVASAGGREAKAIIPFLDVETLKSSKNQADDIKKAIETVKESHDYLFTSNEPVKNAVTRTQTGSPNTEESSALDFARSIMGVKAEK